MPYLQRLLTALSTSVQDPRTTGIHLNFIRVLGLQLPVLKSLLLPGDSLVRCQLNVSPEHICIASIKVFFKTSFALGWGWFRDTLLVKGMSRVMDVRATTYQLGSCTRSCSSPAMKMSGVGWSAPQNGPLSKARFSGYQPQKRREWYIKAHLLHLPCKCKAVRLDLAR